MWQLHDVWCEALGLRNLPVKRRNAVDLIYDIQRETITSSRPYHWLDLVARSCLAYYRARLCQSNALGYKYSGILLGPLGCRWRIHLQVEIGLGHQGLLYLMHMGRILWVVEEYESRLGNMPCDCRSCMWNELLRLKGKERREGSNLQHLLKYSRMTV